MGMDIYGLNPKLTKERPEIDFQASSDEAKKVYFEELNKWEEENPGYYFRANVWSWRPINKIINRVNIDYNLDLDTEGFGSNSGNGIDNQEDCNLLADALEDYIKNNENLLNSQVMYVNMGIWIADDNTFTIKSSQEDKLNRDYPIGSILYSSIITDDGKLVRPAWSVSVSHLREFIHFLRHCGGFEIW